MNTGPFYILICGDHRGTYVCERDVALCTWSSTVEAIVGGEHTNFLQVIEVGTGRDVTEQMVRAAMNEWACGGESLTEYQYHTVEMHIGVNAARSFRRAA
jgi:hypothetical protein